MGSHDPASCTLCTRKKFPMHYASVGSGSWFCSFRLCPRHEVSAPRALRAGSGSCYLCMKHKEQDPTPDTLCRRHTLIAVRIFDTIITLVGYAVWFNLQCTATLWNCLCWRAPISSFPTWHVPFCSPLCTTPKLQRCLRQKICLQQVAS